MLVVATGLHVAVRFTVATVEKLGNRVAHQEDSLAKSRGSRARSLIPYTCPPGVGYSLEGVTVCSIHYCCLLHAHR